MSGTIITIEGNNGSGKLTQAKMLASKFQIRNSKFEIFSYPEYETPAGQLISSYLHGDFGPKEDLFEFAALLYAADRMKNKSTYEKLLAEDAMIINNRYMESNWAIQGSLFGDQAEREQKISWMQEIERDMPRSDLVIFLDMPWQTGFDLIHTGRVANGHAMDSHELDTDFLKRCEQTYRELAKQYGWVRVECIKDGILRTKEDIAEEVWENVKKLI